jgi:hypothetical protein
MDNRAEFFGVVVWLLAGSVQTHQHCVEYANNADQRCDDMDIQTANWNENNNVIIIFTKL